MNKERGFTLIELLVVVAIIGLLSSVVLASLSKARSKSRDVRRIMDLKQLRTAIFMYYSDHNQWPCYNNRPTRNNTYIDGQGHCLAAALVPEYISKIPTDPLYGEDGNRQWGYDYQYLLSVDLNSYSIRTALEGTPLKQDHGYPNGNTCQNGFSKCLWYGESCVYMTGGGCNVQWIQFSENK